MPAATDGHFRIYGAVSCDEDSAGLELQTAALCFVSTTDMRAFARFVLATADSCDEDPEFHDHFFDDSDRDNARDIVVELLRKEDHA